MKFHELTVRSVYAPNLLQLTSAAIRPFSDMIAARGGRVRRGPRRDAHRPTSTPAEAPRPRLAGSAQWARVVALVERAIGRGQRAVEYHAAARFRLDASEYELHRLREDLGALLQRPAGVLTLVAARPAPAAEPRPVALAA